jgi:hypothetical protein
MKTLKNSSRITWNDYNYNTEWESLFSSKKKAYDFKEVLEIAGLKLMRRDSVYMIVEAGNLLHHHDKPFYFGNSDLKRGWVGVDSPACGKVKKTSSYFFVTLDHVAETIINASYAVYSVLGEEYPYADYEYVKDRVNISDSYSRMRLIARLKQSDMTISEELWDHVNTAQTLNCVSLHDYIYHIEDLKEKRPEFKDAPENWIVAAFL